MTESLSLAEPETLLTLAEIAITIAGFSAIVASRLWEGCPL
jgi:hypothetical protein